MLRLRTALWLLALLFPLAAAAQPRTGTLKGTVADAATQEPLAGVNVVVADLGIGAATDADGAFSIPGVPVGTHRIEVRYLGYEPVLRTDLIVQPGRSTVVTVELREAVLEGDAVTVQADYFGRGADPTSVAAFSAEEIRRAPGSGREIARVLSALPGVAARGETSQDLFVRGGSPAENGFYVDGIFVPGVQHFQTGDGSSFGPTGILNTEFIDRIAFSTGGFSAAYGGYTSSVSDIRYRDGAEQFTGEVGVDFTGGTGIVEGGLPGGRGSWFVSGRRSYLDVIAGAIDAGGAPSFGDLQGKLAWQPGRGHELTLLNLFGTSRFEQTAEDAVEDGAADFVDAQNTQNTVGLGWRALWRGDGFTHTTASHSFVRRGLDVRLVDGGARDLAEETRTNHFNLRSTSLWRVAPRLQAEFGGEVWVERGAFELERDPFVARNGEAQPGYRRDETLTDARPGAFASVTVQPTARLEATLGLRADYASLSETATLSPRASASYQLTDRLALSAALGVYRQAVPLLLVSFNDANERLGPYRADHYIAGASYLLTPDTRLTVEAFAKEYRDLPQYTPGNPQADPGFVLDSRGDFSGALDAGGRAWARGVDVLLQKKLAENFYGLASASYFRSRYRDADGAWRNRDFDARLLFSVVGGYKPNDRWEVSARWSYLGDRPFTPIDAAASASLDEEVLDVARFNEERLPAFHSLFLRVDRRFFFPRSSLVTFVSLWNAYNRTNVEGVFWNVTERLVEEQAQFSLLPIIGFEYEF
ncbi:MAG: TonB-dependent receptor [Bacteroidota bacterium]